MVYAVLIVLIFAICILIPLYLKQKKCIHQLSIYQDITESIINTDVKTRCRIEKLCNEYLEHKVINKNNANKKYIEQCYIILDFIKYINLINSIEPLEPKKEENTSIIVSTIENAKIEENKADNKVKKEKSKKEEK